MNYQEEELSMPFSAAAWKKILPFIAVYRNKLILIMFFMVICAVCDTAYPLFLKYAIDNFIQKSTTDGTVMFAVILALTFIVQGLSVFIFIRIAVVVEMNFSKDLRRSVFYHLQKLPFSYYNKTPVGYMMARTMSDTGLIGDRIAWSAVDLVWAGVYIVGILIAVFFLHVKLALILLAAVPVLLVITFFFQIRILRIQRESRRINSRMTAAMNEGIVGAATSKTLVIEEQNFGEFNIITTSLRNKNIQGARYRAIFFPILFFIGSITTAIVLGIGSGEAIDGIMELGTLASFINYSMSIFMPIQQLAHTLTEFIAAQVNVERVTGLLDIVPEIADKPEVEAKYGDNFNPKRENWESITGDVEFKDVTFRYSENAPNILENFNLKIKAGSCIAIVGETGAGKSTIVNLICRFFEPNDGQILIDGVDIRERSQLWLHSNLGYVLQTPHLFSGTVRDNIIYGKLDATEEEIKAAAKMVSADIIIEKLEHGYDTDVGEGGSRLSTGQKQLISLARAVITNPRLFILDEATSSIDTETEQLIQQAITTVLENRTSFLIAHRLSTIKHADLILVVDDGEIIERGTHDELMKQKKRYYQLYTRQFEEEINI